MQNKKINVTALLILASTVVTFALLFYAFLLEDSFNNGMTIENVHIVGSYRIGEKGKLYELTPDTKFNTFTNETIYIYGSFSQDIPENLLLIFNIANIRAEVYLNDEMMFSYGYSGRLSYLSRSEGYLWHVEKSKGISRKDRLTVKLNHIYPYLVEVDIARFIKRIYMGYERPLINMLLSEYGFHISIGIIVLCIGFTLLIATIILTLRKAKDITRYVYMALFIISFGVYLLFYFDVISFIIPYPIANNIIAIYSVAFLPVFGIPYITAYFGKFTTRLLMCFFYLSIAGICLLPLTLFTKDLDIFDTQYFFVVITGLFCFVSIACLIFERYVKKNISLKYIAETAIFIAVGGIIDVISFYLYFVPPYDVVLTIAFVSFVIVLFVTMVNSIFRRMQIQVETEHLKNELLQNKIAMMLSQIGPHFLFNSLEVIISLCDTEPQIAKQSAKIFARYLRYNLDALTQNELIPMEKELEHIKQFAYLQIMRFGNLIKMEYDLKVKNFFVPTLTIEPLVENAINHGIIERENGGTITISSIETENSYVIHIVDDGVGFDVNLLPNDNRTHIGIENVRKRLKAQCEGCLLIESTVGVGTTATVTIPKWRDGV